MQATKLNDGDLVRLKSGGPVMTAERVSYMSYDSYAHCTWFNAREQMQKAYFKTAALEPAARPDPGP